LLTQAEGESYWISFYRAPVGVSLVNGVITLPGSGFYSVSPQTGVTDDLTGITLAAENVIGCTVRLAPAAAGQTIIVRHQAGLHLVNGTDAILSTIYSGIWLRHAGSSVFFEVLARTNVP
jgi:hypothetical protein